MKIIKAFAVCLFAMTWPMAAIADPEAKLIYFTEDGTRQSAPLLRGFVMNSVWNAIGRAANGTIYMAVSNHDEVNGNVAIFALDPEADRMRFVNEIRAVSQGAGNWVDGESQYKVHTFLNPRPDGVIYFATMPSTDPRESRGAHLYALDPETETITDVGATLPFTITREGKVVPGKGVLIEGQGIKGMAFHASNPETLYLMAYPTGIILRYDLRTGLVDAIGRSPRVSYIFHVDAEGDVYYLGGGDGETSEFLRFNVATGETKPLLRGIDPDEEVGMIAPTSNPDVVLVLFAKSKTVVPVNTATEKVLRGGASCGRNWWRLFNMTVSPDGQWAYFVSNNNDHSMIWRVKSAGGKCQKVVDVNDLLGDRNLAFGGQNVWAGDSFYTPVWRHDRMGELAILKVAVK